MIREKHTQKADSRRSDQRSKFNRSAQTDHDGTDRVTNSPGEKTTHKQSAGHIKQHRKTNGCDARPEHIFKELCECHSPFTLSRDIASSKPNAIQVAMTTAFAPRAIPVMG